ncbi:MAG: glutamate--tRNA ligase [Candidatus Dasytiphilus stammeri]
MKIKTRFAPSPTGDLHIGGVRTALYSWLFARKHGGNFLLRIEDTDYFRSTKKSRDAIIEGLTWLKIDWNEGPYYQSERLDRYNAVIHDMLERGHAYKCYCTKKRLENMRNLQISMGNTPRYDGHCRNIDDHFQHHTLQPYVVRFKNPQQGTSSFKDLIRGNIIVKNQELDDLVILRSDGTPTYNFCVAIDDWDMKITHVIRGDDHITNTFRQINILKSLDAFIPSYAHVSMILDESSQKISKRHNGWLSIMHYRNEGYLPEAMINYLVRLGWSSGNREILSLEEIKVLFTLEGVSKSASTLNPKKLLWLNHHYINKLPATYVASQLQWQMTKENLNPHNGPSLTRLVELYGLRCKTLKEIVVSSRYLYEEITLKDNKFAQQYLTSRSQKSLERIREKLNKSSSSEEYWQIATIHNYITSTAADLGISVGQVAMPLRVAITGTNTSPSIASIVHALGKECIIRRINNALNFIRVQ